MNKFFRSTVSALAILIACEDGGLLSNSTPTPAAPANSIGQAGTDQPFISTTGQRTTDTGTVDTTGLTNPTYQWKSNGVDIGGATTSSLSFAARAMQVLSCTVVADQGTFETPGVKVYMDMANASHNADDDAILDLVPHADSTFIAVSDGAWSTASTWDQNAVPTAGAVVLIPSQLTVTHDQLASIRYHRIRVDGVLTSAIDQNTEMLVETVVVTQGGRLIMGAGFATNIPTQFDANWEFSNRDYPTSSVSPTDLNLTTDPRLWGRGLLVQGDFTAFGASRTPWVNTVNNGPSSGATSVTLQSAPNGWAVGDTIHIPGTLFGLQSDDSITSQDEVRTITSITNGGLTINWTGGLTFDHGLQNSAITRTDFKLPIINVTKNINFTGEGGDGVDVWRRAHFSMMHGQSTSNIWDISFGAGMGRTDKTRNSGIIDHDGSQTIDTGVSGSVDTFAGAFVHPRAGIFNGNTAETLTAQSNLQARYPVHWHHPGYVRGAHLAQNCHVEGSPGWGMVHHTGRVDLFFNTVRNARGAGIVAEQGSEVGGWVSNVVYGLTVEAGQGTAGGFKGLEETAGINGDRGRWGYGMLFIGRGVRNTNNVCICSSHGYVFYPRDIGPNEPTISRPQNMFRDHTDLSDLGPFQEFDTDRIDVVDYPLGLIDSNGAIGCGTGIGVTKNSFQQNHAFHINIQKMWGYGCVTGSDIEYVGQYLLADFDFTSVDPALTARPSLFATTTGMRVGPNAQAMVLVRPTLEGFGNGIFFEQNQGSIDADDYNGTNEPNFAVFDADLINCTADYGYLQDWTVPGEAANSIQDITRIEGTVPSTALSHSIPTELFHWNDSGTVTNVGSGTITDSMGTRPIPYFFDSIGYAHTFNIEQMYNRTGYWQFGGNNVALVPMYYTEDRVTGRPLKKMQTIRLLSGSPLGNSTDNGSVVQSATGPSRSDIAVNCPKNGSINIDVLTAATGEAGATLSLDNQSHWVTTNPPIQEAKHGTVTANADGISFDYEADPENELSDFFYCFVYDGRLNFTTVRVDITIT